MGHIRVGVRRGPGAYTVDGPPEWLEIDGVRLPDTAGIFSIEHESIVNEMGKVTVKMYSGGYETVSIDEVTPKPPDLPFSQWPPIRRIEQIAGEMMVRFMGGATSKELQAWARDLNRAVAELDYKSESADFQT